MASKHEQIKWKVIEDWTASDQGRLYCMNQGLAVPWAEFVAAMKGGKGLIALLRPKWFGPLKRKFKGFPDTFGYELEGVAIFCTVEVKTKGDRVKKDQRLIMDFLTTQGVRCYVAWEDETEPRGYRIERWGVMLT